MSNEIQNEPLNETLAPQVTLGAWLTQARMASGLSVQEIALRTNRSVKQISDLETDNLASFNAHVLLRGIVCQYAKTVGADEEQAVKLIPESFKPRNNLEWIGVSNPKKIPKPRNTNPTPWLSRVAFVVFSIVLVVLLAYWIFGARLFKNQGEGQKSNQPNQVQVINPPVAAPAAPVTPAASEPAPAPVTAAPTAPPAAVTAPVVDANATPAAAPANSSDAVLRLKFTGDVWTEVRDVKGKVLLAGIQKASDVEQTIQGELPLSVKFGDGTKVQMSWKGQPYDLVPVMKGNGTKAKIQRLE